MNVMSWKQFYEFGFLNYAYGLLHLAMMRRFLLIGASLVAGSATDEIPSRSSFFEPRQGTNQQLTCPKNDAHKMTNYVDLLKIIIVVIIQNDETPFYRCIRGLGDAFMVQFRR